jgi:hypothetical protein
MATVYVNGTAVDIGEEHLNPVQEAARAGVVRNVSTEEFKKATLAKKK